MAFKLLFICVLIVASAKANIWDNNPAFQAFKLLPQFPNFQIPTMAPINIPKPLSVEDIMKKAEREHGPNDDFNTVVVRSSSSVSTGPDGKPVKKGGVTILTNNNGEQHTVEYGNDPPKINKASSTENNEVPKIIPIVIPQITIPQIPIWQPFDLLKPLSQANGASGFQFVSPNGAGSFQSVNVNSNGGGGFASASSSSFSQSTDEDGVKTGGGVSSTFYNVNGQTGGETIHYTSN